MHQLQKIIQGALASVTITIFSLTSAAAFAQAGHYFNDNKHVTVDWPHFDHEMIKPQIPFIISTVAAFVKHTSIHVS